ncbi:hypothetical protein, variant [Verruconis gallopava]|nr:hypothetical protein, variant [Verruconis gallopava]KIW07867.1 hypothetical protein, variant [Verruconis gallopava]
MDTVGNHPVTQSAKDTVVNGPVGQSVQKETAKTSSEFKDLAAARQTPDTPAATGQPLTHYHSMFYRLLSWKNPRATTITFLATVAFIFAARYLNVIRYTFKALYLVLGVTAASEVAGRLVLGEGIATKLRPKKYFVIPKESLERLLDDVEQLINFFVIEFQRVVFAENIWATFLAFISSFISYWLIKWLPLWGLALIFDVFLFIGPLIYIKNQAIIDQHLSHAKEVASAQASQVREIAAQHTGRATESLKGYTSEYTKKAQEMIGQARGKASGVQASDLPNAPKDEPVAKASEPEPVPAL